MAGYSVVYISRENSLQISF